MSAIRKYIPDAITCMNLLCGCLGVVAAFNGYFDQAFMLMLLASVFDFCDGLAARMLGAYSDLGKELDSLSDVVSFGVLPAVMMVCYMSQENGDLTGGGAVWVKILCLVPLVLAVFSGLRLAKFNIDTRQTDSFLGLPTPGCAMLCASLVCFSYETPDSFIASWCSGLLCLPLLSVCMSCLLICELPMFSLKIHKGDDFKSAEYIVRYCFIALFVVLVVTVPVLRLHWSLIFTLALLMYVLMNAVRACLTK